MRQRIYLKILFQKSKLSGHRGNTDQLQNENVKPVLRFYTNLHFKSRPRTSQAITLLFLLWELEDPGLGVFYKE